jgi:LysR family transcriptional activator of dmlA
VLCAAPAYLTQRGYPKTLADLAGHDCLMYRERHQTFGVWRLQGPNGPESVKVTGVMGSNQSDIVHQWALAGLGIIPLASWDVAGLLREGALVRVLPQYHQSADVWAVTACRLDQSAKLCICTELLISQLQCGPYALDTSVR